MRAEEFLKDIKITRATVRRWSEQVEYYQTKLNKETKDISAPKVTVVGDKDPERAGLWDNYLYAKEKLDKVKAEYDREVATAMDILDQFTDPMLADLIYFKYIDTRSYTWQELAEKVSLSERQVYRAFESAMEEFSSFLRLSEKS